MNASIHFFYRFGYLFCCLFLFYATSLVGQYRFNALSNEELIISENSPRNNKTLGVEFQVVDIRAHQLNLLSFVPPIPFSPEGMLILYYTSTLPFYLTIGAERPLAGFTFVAQNLYAAVALSNLNMIAIRFSLQQLGITPGMQWPPSALLRIYLHFSQQPVPNPGQDFYQYDLEVRPLDDDASNEYADSTSEEPPLDQSDPPPNLNSPITSRRVCIPYSIIHLCRKRLMCLRSAMLLLMRLSNSKTRGYIVISKTKSARYACAGEIKSLLNRRQSCLRSAIAPTPQLRPHGLGSPPPCARMSAMISTRRIAWPRLCVQNVSQ